MQFFSILLIVILSLATGTQAAEEAPVAVTVKAAFFTSLSNGLAGENDSWSLTNNGQIACAFDFPTNGLYTLVLVARGEAAAGEWPLMSAGVNGNTGVQVRVKSAAWSTYVFSQSVSNGVQEVFVNYLNDASAPGADRNLHLRHLSVVSPAHTPVVSTLSREGVKNRETARRDKAVEEAQARIVQVRKGTLAIAVINPQGEPVSGVSIKIQQSRHEFLFGCALCPRVFDGSLPAGEAEEFLNQFKLYFNCADTGEALNWASMEPVRGQARNETMDGMVAWCASNRIPLRGQGLFRGCEDQIPGWIPKLSNDELRTVINKRTRAVVARWKGRVDEFDILQDALRCPYFQERLGRGIIRQMFHEARTANPHARLYIDDRIIPNGEMLEKLVAEIQEVIDAGVVLDGLGVRARLGAGFDPLPVQQTLDALARFNVPIKITGVSCETEDEDVQARNLKAFYQVAFGHPEVEAILMETFWQGCSAQPRAAILGADFSRKPAAKSFEKLVFEDWWTRETGLTDDEGLFSCGAFFGDVVIKAKSADGKVAQKEISLLKANGTASVVLQLADPDAAEKEKEMPVAR